MTNITDDILCFGANEQGYNHDVTKSGYASKQGRLNLRKVKFKFPEHVDQTEHQVWP